MMNVTPLRTLLLILFAGLVLPACAALVPQPEPWSVWQTSDEDNPLTIFHGDWQTLLDRYLDSEHPSGIARFDYANVTAADRALLGKYLIEMQAIDPRAYSRNEQRAYWINLYNAQTVALILDYFPVKSIREIEGGLFDLGPWDEEVLTVAGIKLTLNDIEHRLLRPQWRDPRIHYALNCASLGCPNLAPQAFTGANTETLLDAGARAYINHPRGASFDGKRLKVSTIYKWFRVDFGDSEQGVISHLAEYAEPELRKRLEAYDRRLKYAYDWDLNAP